MVHIYEQPKNGKGQSIKLTQVTSEALKAHLRRQLEEIEGLVRRLPGSGPYIPWRAWSTDASLEADQKAREDTRTCWSPPIRFHDLRHTCATLMLCEGVHIKIVQELLGHADVTITLNTYSHVLPSMGGEAAGAMDRIFG